uniref:VWFA domain-containing protein n=1 Tax=Sus scrofa TaxID=9823 RepID=A0A8D2A4L7_PIG
MPTSDLPIMMGTRIGLLLVLALASSLCFNLDTDQPTIFRVDSAGFGHSVVQYANWLVVGAPQEVRAANQTGGLYRCDYSTSLCEAIHLQVPPEAVNMSLGLSMAATTKPFQLLACGPTVQHACQENMHLTGFCFLLVSQSQQAQRIPAALQECPRQEQDIAFLIDGSGSIDYEDFTKMLNFVRAVISQFRTSNAQFALVQFSSKFKEHFTFRAFAASSNPLRLLSSIQQLGGYTHTASAIRKVTRELFIAAKGARKDASKILIVITDGQKTGDPLGYKDVIPQAEAAGIIRYAIGVGSAFQHPKSLEELKDIASKPSHIFKVDNFDALRDVQNQLKEKIFAIEGTQTISSSSFELEMSQEGFSAVFMPVSRTQTDIENRLVVAKVGGKGMGWEFGVSRCKLLHREQISSKALVSSMGNHIQYQGISHIGKDYKKECRRAKWQCRVILRGEQGHPWSRFGAALTALGDVNGDRLTDVAIGAPGEQDNRGAVYLFHGTSELSISPSHSQRVAGSQLSPRLQYFGRSLSGGQDLTMDGLVDLAVGAQGHALLLRSRPVLRVWANIRILPKEITRSLFECPWHTSSVQDLGNATVCLQIYESPKTRLGDLQSSVTFDLTLDPGRLSPRAVFKETKTRNLTRVQVLGLSEHCETVRLLLPACVEDSMAPVVLRLNYSLVGKPIPGFGKLQPMLAVDAERYFTALLPFEKNCGADHVCQDDLSITFGVSGLKTLVVGSNLELDLEVTVRNDGEDSYGTTITFFYPPGLSYRRVTEAQNQRQPRSLLVNCDSTPTQSQGPRSTRCGLNHFIFREGAQVTFVVTFDVNPKAQLGDRLLLTANVSSENNTPRTSKTTFRLELPVKYAVYPYLNFSASEEGRRSQAQHRYQVNNLGQRDLPVSIAFSVPVELNRVAVWTDVEIFHPQNPSIQCSSERTSATESDVLTHFKKNPVLNCSMADCLRFRCDVPSFGVQEELDFSLRGNLSFDWISQTAQKKVLVVSVAEITFDRSVYSQLPGQEAFLRAQMEMVLEEYEVHNPVPLIVGSSVGGLLLLVLITAVLYKVRSEPKSATYTTAHGNTRSLTH